PHCLVELVARLTSFVMIFCARFCPPQIKGLIQFDQFGYALAPVRVICRRSFPSRATVKICVLPARVELNAICRPFGEKHGLSFVPSPNVNCRIAPVASSSTLMSLPGPVLAAYAISLYGAGDHVARSAFDSWVSGRKPSPSTP